MVPPISRRGCLATALGLAGWSTALRADDEVPEPDRPRTAPRLQVLDEFGSLRRVAVHDARNVVDVDHEEAVQFFGPDLMREHPETGAISKQAVVGQQSRFLELLARRGVELVFPLPVPDASSQVFTRDPSFVVGETLYLGVLRDAFRISEVHGLTPILDRADRVIDLEGPGVLIEGGDVLVLDGGRVVLVGTNRHTNDAGIHTLSAWLHQDGTRVVRVPHRALHLDCSLAPLPSGDALFVPSKLPERSVERVRPFFGKLIPVDRDEGTRNLAANLLWLDRENVVANRDARKTIKLLEALKYKVHPLEYANVVMMWGSFRCTTCPLLRT